MCTRAHPRRAGRKDQAGCGCCPPNLHGNEGSHQLGQPSSPGCSGVSCSRWQPQPGPCWAGRKPFPVLWDRGNHRKVLGGTRAQGVAGPVLCRHFSAVRTGNIATRNFIQPSFQYLAETRLNKSAKQISLLAQASFGFNCPEYEISQLEYRYFRASAERKIKPNHRIQRVLRAEVGL